MYFLKHRKLCSVVCFLLFLYDSYSLLPSSAKISIEASHKRNLFVHADWNKHKSKKKTKEKSLCFYRQVNAQRAGWLNYKEKVGLELFTTHISDCSQCHWWLKLELCRRQFHPPHSDPPHSYCSYFRFYTRFYRYLMCRVIAFQRYSAKLIPMMNATNFVKSSDSHADIKLR